MACRLQLDYALSRSSIMNQQRIPVRTDGGCADTRSRAPDCEVRLTAALNRFAVLNLAAPLARTLGLAAWRPATVVLRSCLHHGRGAQQASLNEVPILRLSE